MQVMIVEDQPLVVEGLRSVLTEIDSEPDIRSSVSGDLNPNYGDDLADVYGVLRVGQGGTWDLATDSLADITWVGFTGRTVPAEVARAFDTAARARDAAVALVQRATRAGDDLRGWQVGRAAREVLEGAGYRDEIWHRTGHSLGETVHGNGVNMDDYETHDDRRLLPGTGFTIEPGLYFPTFGVRTEINVFVTDRDALVTGPLQDRVLPLVG